MENTQFTPPVKAPHTTVGQLREKYGQHFAEGYEESDPITAVLGRAGIATLGEYLHLHLPASR